MTRSSTNSSSTGGPSENRFGLSAGRVLSEVQQAFEELRRPAEQRGDTRPGRDDARDPVLIVLAERPMHGYQVVRALEARSHGVRTLGAGAVYPTLQLLADEGLATVAEEDGRKVYSLTASGRIAAQAARDRSVRHDSPDVRAPERRGAMAKAGAQLAQTAALVAHGGTPEQVADAVAVLDDARRKLHTILARN